MATFKKQLYKEMDSIFYKYRICKYLVEAGDYNHHDFKQYKAYCDWVEAAINRLPEMEKALITERYMKDDYVTDFNVYQDVLMIAAQSYDKIRLKAFTKIDQFLKICG